MSINFFISYTRNDEQWAKWIAGALEEAGCSTVLQAWDFRPGENFVELQGLLDQVIRSEQMLK
jgi:hypothetical protein